MKKALIVIAAMLAATSGYAKEKKPKEPAPPHAEAAPAIVDVRLGDETDQICTAAPMTTEPYDGHDNVLIVEGADQSHAILALSGECDFNSLMFAEEIAPSADKCLKKGDEIVVSDSFGGSRRCKVVKINAWNPDAEILPDNQDDDDQPY